jgi:CheY-like chemotaxis protein
VGVSEDGVNNYGNTLIFTGSTTHKTVSLPGFDSPIYDVLCMVKATAVEYNSNSHFSSPKDAYLPLFWTTERKVVMSAPTFLQPEAGTETLAKMENPRSRTVLCVDDERIGLRVRKIMLESRGYTVLTANSGDEGLKMFDENHVDVVVLDYFMPGLNGGEVASEMRRRRPGVPIVFLSAYFSLPPEALELADAFITKGDPPDVLIEKLQRLV